LSADRFGRGKEFVELPGHLEPASGGASDNSRHRYRQRPNFRRADSFRRRRGARLAPPRSALDADRAQRHDARRERPTRLRRVRMPNNARRLLHSAPLRGSLARCDRARYRGNFSGRRHGTGRGGVRSGYRSAF
jgi:hypothetical protein